MQFEKLNEFFNKVEHTQKAPPTPGKMDGLGSFNKDTFRNTIPYFENMSEHDIAVLIKNNIDKISNDIITGNSEYKDLFKNMKFISSFIRAISSIPIDTTIRLACNRLTYDSFTEDKPDRAIKEQYLNMSKIVNKDIVNKLLSLNLDENTAINLALCRYSSSNEQTNVKRVNFTLYHKDPYVMSDQMIVWIYEKLFDRISDLFYGTMLETYSVKTQEENGENFIEIYGRVGNCVLLILNNMTTSDITKVVAQYSNLLKYKNYPPTRFSLRTLSADYERISNVVESLIASGYYIP